MPKRQKGFAGLGILIVVLVLALIGGGLLVWQKVLAPEVQPTPVPVVLSSPVPTSTTTIIPSSVSQPTPTSDPTLGWKTYTNSILSFKYPGNSDWQAYPSENSSVAVMCETCSVDSTVDLFQVGTVIFKSIDEYMQKDTLTTDREKILLSGYEAVKGIQSGGPQAGGSMLQVFVVYKGQGYLIGEGFKKAYDKSTLEQLPLASPNILPTFKFLN